MTDTADILTAPEAAEVLGVKPRRVRQLVESGILVGDKHGHDWLFTRAEVERVKALDRPRGRRWPPKDSPPAE